MYKRYFIFAFICLLSLVAGSRHASAQQQVAQDAYAIFEQSCIVCHGADGAFRETLLIDHSTLIDTGVVVPRSPDDSELYRRVLGPTENGAQMPLGQPQLSAAAIDTIRRWITAGAPDWTATSTPLRRFITPREVLTSIESHLNVLSSFDRSFARYFTMTHLYNAGETPEILGEYRKALSKLVNSLSWRLKITNPQPIDPQETIFYIDLRHYEWDRNDGWTKIEDAYPYHISAPAQLAIRNQLGRLQTSTKTDVPSVHIDWFIAKAAAPPLYDDLLSLPSSVQELETRLEVDVARNLRDAPGIEVWRAGFNNSGVSNHNRVVERHTSRYGAYWKSYDFAGNVGTQNIFVHPFNFTHDGGEIIFNLPNGLQGYYLVDGSGFRLDEAPISIVSNPAASDPTVRNGISCIGCHTEGMKTFEDDVRSAIEGNPNPPYNKAHALRLYVEKSVMDALVAEDMEKYRVGLEATGGTFSGVEPVSRFHEAFHGPIDAAYAAAVVGLQTETFLERVRENTGLQNVGLLALDSADGTVKRDAWTSSFRDIISALDYPDQVGQPPIVTQPDVIPGRLIDIPDPNLRSLLEDTLETKIIRPDVMATLTSLKASGRNISDLTGLEFAVNLEELWLLNNPVSDLSALANLTKLEVLELAGDISDISPLAGLTNLRVLWFYNSDVSNISAVSGMTKLEKFGIRHSPVEDITPLARLVNLQELNLHDCPIADISPLGNLTRLRVLIMDGGDRVPHIPDLTSLGKLTDLEELDIGGTGVTDLSGAERLTRLRVLRADHAQISDVSRLAGLTNLIYMILHDNQISDVAPLSGLVNLEYLDVSRNMINDITPLASLENLVVAWNDNPGFPGGPKIAGPWLWVTIPQENLRRSPDVDFLSKASGGTVTELGVATHGAIEGKSVGDDKWTSHLFLPTMSGNIRELFNLPRWLGIIYGSISLYSPREQNTTMYIGNDEGTKVWLNGALVYELLSRDGSGGSYEFSFPVTLRRGNNVLLVAVQSIVENSGIGASFGFEKDTDYTVSKPRVGYTFSHSPISLGDTFTLDITAEDVHELAGWQFDIAFDPVALEAVNVSEGDFLKTDGGAIFFQSGRIDNASGRITGLIAGRISEGGVSGSGSILQAKFKAKSEGETELALQNFLFGSANDESIPAAPLEIRFTVEERLLTGDVNRDGVVNILDLLRVARQLGQRVGADSPVDINGDGIVNIFDLTLVAQGIGGAAAPPAQGLDSTTIQMWISEARLADDGSLLFRQGIANLETLLATLIPKETALLANYPNPFNPETWIPYQLAEDGDVDLSIYDAGGRLVRRLDLGHRAAGYCTDKSKAAYWDGRNDRGEFAASGVYFYTLSAGGFTATRKMLILK